jgi:hypothetical protein
MRASYLVPELSAGTPAGPANSKKSNSEQSEGKSPPGTFLFSESSRRYGEYDP